MTDHVTGLRVEVSPFLAGAKRAVRIGDTVIVSPPMHDLMRHATTAELAVLLASIPVQTVPYRRQSRFEAVPLTSFAY